MRLAPRLTAGLTATTLVLGTAALGTAVVGTAVVGTAAHGAGLAPGTASAATPNVGGEQLALPGIQMQAKDGRSPAPLPAITASSWVVADADTGAVLASKNAHLQRRPASTLKTLTALTLLPKLDPADTYVPDYSDIAIEGSKVGIVNGSTYTIDQLFHGLFLASGNDAAQSLAKANGGVKRTVKEMNAEAKRLQANNTVARTPSGLDAPGQRSSAYDLALIARAGLNLPAFAEHAATLSVKFPREGTKGKRKTFMVYNHNPLVIGGYRGAIGVKTGYTVLAGRTFVGAAERGDRKLIVTLMNYGGTTYQASSALLDWGFANAKKVEPVGVLVDPLPDATESSTDSTDSAADGATSGGEASGAASSDGVTLWPFALVALALALVAGVATGRIRWPARKPVVAGAPHPGGADAGAPYARAAAAPPWSRDLTDTGPIPVVTREPAHAGHGHGHGDGHGHGEPFFDRTSATGATSRRADADEVYDDRAEAEQVHDADTGPIPVLPRGGLDDESDVTGPIPVVPREVGSNVRTVDPREAGSNVRVVDPRSKPDHR